MTQSPTQKILKKRGRKPKNKNIDISNTIIEEQIDSDKEVIIAYRHMAMTVTFSRNVLVYSNRQTRARLTSMRREG